LKKYSISTNIGFLTYAGVPFHAYVIIAFKLLKSYTASNVSPVYANGAGYYTKNSAVILPYVSLN